MRKRGLFTAALTLLLGLSQPGSVIAAGLAPLPAPQPQEPRNKRDVAKFGDPSEIKQPGFFLYSSVEGIKISPIQSFRPQLIPNTGRDPDSVHVTDDGRWILFIEGDKVYLIRPDGSSKTLVPVTPLRPQEGPRTATFYYNGPNGDEVVFLEAERVLTAIAVDLSGETPKFGAKRPLVDFTGVDSNALRWAQSPEQRLTVAADHVFVSMAGWAGSVQAWSITIPDGGRGVARSMKDVWKPTQSPKWECGPAMSHCGRIVSQNPGGLVSKENYPVEIGHKGFVVMPFQRPDDEPLNVPKLYEKKALAVCWVPASVRHEKGDWHHWYYSNDPAWVIGTSQGARNLQGKVEDFKAIGIYLVHWPSGVYYRVSDERTRALYLACHFFRPESRASIKLPPGFGAGAASAQRSAPPAKAPAARTAAAATVVLEVTAQELSTVPDKQDIGVYKHISRFIRYDVTRVVRGQYEGKSIVVGHWSVKDGVFTPAARYTAGQRFLITCVPVAGQDVITLSQRIDDIQDLDLPRYWATSVQVQK
jgi:hypothetical protein